MIWINGKEGDYIMNMLIIGNGFDLAHKLPTSYKDFLQFVEEANNYRYNFSFKYPNITEKDKKDKRYFDFFIDVNKQDSEKGTNNFKFIDKIHELSKDNLWFKYFSETLKNNKLYLKENWIDFESEISKVIQFLDELNTKKNSFISKNNDKFFIDEPFFLINDNEMAILAKTFNTFFNDYETYFKNLDEDEIEDYKDKDEGEYKFFLRNFELLKKTILSDLNKLIRCLEIYLSFYINSLDTGVRIPEIIDLAKNNLDYILSFNYTNTFERFYDSIRNNKDDKDLSYDYIHGKASLKNDVDTCPLVLGIDEYLDDTEKNINIEFIQYKKYFQRIYKKTGCEYISLLEDLKELNDFANKKEQEKNNTLIEPTTKKEVIPLNIYIFGHSLDITDKDVLYRLIMHDNAKTTIYYHDDDSYKKQIANLVRVLSQDVLIDSVYGMNPRIKFEKQIEVKESKEKSIVESEIKEVSTIAAHNDHLKDPDEKENIQTDLDEMDNWDNEE